MFVVDNFVCGLVVSPSGSSNSPTDFLTKVVSDVSESIKSGVTDGVLTVPYLVSCLAFGDVRLPYRDGTTKPVSDLFPVGFFPVFLLSAPTSLLAGELADLFADNPGKYEVTTPEGARARLTDLESLSWSPSKLAKAEGLSLTVSFSKVACETLSYYSLGKPTNSYSSSLLTVRAQGTTQGKTTNKKTYRATKEAKE